MLGGMMSAFVWVGSDAPLTEELFLTSMTATNKSLRSLTTSLSSTLESDADCPFRNSPIYRKVFVYPNHGDVENGWSGDILSEWGKDLDKLPRWPFLDVDIKSRNASSAHYNPKSQIVQYNTELLVREVITNPKSCLRTYNPEEADLFYVPYLPSVEFHIGKK